MAMDLEQQLTQEVLKATTRRHFFKQAGFGIGSAALGSVLNPSLLADNASVSKGPMFPAKAKSIIYLFMAGAPSQVDLFDSKPTLQKYDGQNIPDEFVKGERFAFIKGKPKLLGSPFEFTRCGKSGAEISELLPHMKTVADDIAVIRSMHTTQFNHAPAQIFMNTGSQQFGRPSLGSWSTYGLGSEGRDLPAFVVFSTGQKGTSGGAANYGCGFLPTVHQGVPFRGQGDPVLYLSNPPGVDDQIQRGSIDAIAALNRQHLGAVGDPEIATRINNFELAYRMQSSAPDLMDLSKESPETLAMYGAEPGKSSYANACLLSRRLIERGVRFVQVFHEAWDHHGGLVSGLKEQCGKTDKASAALVKDLKRRGLLEDTLVIWGGEFGRTPMVQGGNDGRDHHPNAFTMWLAGGGIKPGITLGKTDDLGFNAVEDKVHVHDLQATILHLLGFDHTRLTYRFQGRDFRLTDVHGELVEGLLA
jgi:hypothetical protein